MIERPPPGAGRGALSVPPSVVGAVTVGLVVAVAAHYLYRARRKSPR